MFKFKSIAELRCFAKMLVKGSVPYGSYANSDLVIDLKYINSNLVISPAFIPIRLNGSGGVYSSFESACDSFIGVSGKLFVLEFGYSPADKCFTLEVTKLFDK